MVLTDMFRELKFKCNCNTSCFSEWYDKRVQINKQRIATYKKVCKKYMKEKEYEKLMPDR